MKSTLFELCLIHLYQFFGPRRRPYVQHGADNKRMPLLELPQKLTTFLQFYCLGF